MILDIKVHQQRKPKSWADFLADYPVGKEEDLQDPKKKEESHLMVIQASSTSDPKQPVLTSDPMVPKYWSIEELSRGYPIEPLDDSQRVKQMFLLDEWSEGPKTSASDPKEAKRSENEPLKALKDPKEQEKEA